MGVSLERALAQVPSALPAQVAGYWANRDFFADEFAHLLSVIRGYPARLEQMKAAYKAHCAKTGVPECLDEFGTSRQHDIKATTSPQDQRNAASDARAALKKLADRALDLGIAKAEEYDEFVARLKVEGEPNARVVDRDK